MADLAYTIDRLNRVALAVTFHDSQHVYEVRRSPRGYASVTLLVEGAILADHRLDLHAEKARAAFAASLNGRADFVLAELIVLARIVDHESDGDDDDDSADGGVPYEETPHGLVWLKPTPNGAVRVPLTNFTANIAADVAEDDGAEVRRSFTIRARLNDRHRSFAVPAERFASMAWATEHLGANALIYPGPAVRDHARAAIQLLSGEVPEHHVFAHLGWREIDGAPVYLHAGGGIGRDGPVPGIEVSVPAALSRFALPAPADGDELVASIKATLALLQVAPLEITGPLHAAIWRAVLGACDFSIHLAGPTGEGKSELAARVQQHWGPGLDARHLPGSWSSTGNANEGLAFVAKDAIVTIDDFAPGGTVHDVARQHREADRLLRAQGNRSGRLRMRADASLRVPKPPRGLILSTGEDVPRGQSLRGRLLALELPPGAVDWQRLTAAQRDASDGHYAQALVGFVGWIAREAPQQLSQYPRDVEAYRAQALTTGQHRRTPEIVANLAVGLRYFLDFAHDAGAIAAPEADDLWRQGWAALGDAAASQPRHQAASEPTRQFIAYLTAALANGKAHVAGPDGNEPKGPAAWGWRFVVVGTGEYERGEWRSQGERVGWLDGNDLYLEPEASFAAAQDLARREGDAIPVTAQTLRRRLHERRLLASTDERRETVTVRRTLGGTQRTVLHFDAARFGSPSPEEPDKPDNGATGRGSEAPNDPPMSDRLSGSDRQPDTEEPHDDRQNWANVGFVGIVRGESGSGTMRQTGVSGPERHPTGDPTSNPTSNDLPIGCLGPTACRKLGPCGRPECLAAKSEGR